MSQSFRRWFQRCFSASEKTSKARARRDTARILLERLEERTAPAVNLLTSFAGLNSTDSGFVPPDTQGAAGSGNTYVQTANQVIGLFSKATGSRIGTDQLSDFWYNQGGLPQTDSGSFLSDPIIVWDEQIGRFIAGDQDVDFSTHVSNFDLAISRNADPLSLTKSDWTFVQVSTTENGYDADYPGNFGWNHDVFCFTLNMFGANTHAEVNALDINSLIGGTAVNNRQDISDFAVRPTVMHDSVAGDPMWFISQGGNNQSINVYRMDNPDNPASTFITQYNLGVKPYFAVVPPLQPDGSAITFNIDSRIDKAAEMGNNIVCSQAISNAAGDRDIARWYEINVSSPTNPVIADEGDFTDPATGAGNAGVYDVYPAVDINQFGAIGMCYSQSGTDSPTDFMSGYVTGRQPTDPAGTMLPAVLAFAGSGINFDGREGDMSGINVDFTDGTFWATTEITDAGNNWNEVGSQFRIPSFSTDVDLTNGNLKVTDFLAGVKNNLIVSEVNIGGNQYIQVRDANNTLGATGGAIQLDQHTVVALLSAVTGNFLVGPLDGNDTLTLDYSGGNPTASTGLTYDGGPGSNTLLGPNVSNSWDVSSTDTGTLNGNIVFKNVANIVGGSIGDTFLVEGGAQITGEITGGPTGFDTLDLSNTGQGVPTGLSAGTNHGYQTSTGALPAVAMFDNIDYVIAAGTHLVVAIQPTVTNTTVVGNTFNMAVVLEDRFGTVNQTFTGAVALSIANGPSGASIGGTSTLTAVLGVANFTNLSLNKSGTYTLQASSAGLNPVFTNPFTIYAAAPTQVVVTTQPPAIITAGTPFSITVAAEDSSGVVAPLYTGSVIVSILFNAGGSTLGGTTKLNFVLGVATFSGLTLNKSGTDYTLQASSGALIPGSTVGFSVVAGAATHFVITTQPPANTTAGNKFDVVAMAEDNFANVDLTFTNSVSIAVTPSSYTGVLSGNVNVPAVKGVAKFTALSLNRPGNTTLDISTSGVPTVTTSSISVAPGIAVQLVFNSTAEPPASIPAGNTFGTTVQVEDSLGNVVTGFGGDVVLSLANNPTGGALLGPLTQPVINGVAVFSGLSLDTADAGYPGNGYALLAVASDNSLTPGTSTRFDITALAATHLAVVTQPPASTTAGLLFTTAIAGVDPFGNVDPKFNGSVTLNFAPGGNPSNTTLGGTLMQNAVNGVATFANLSLTAADPGYQLQASGLVQGSASAATTSLFTITAGTATQFVVTTQPANVTVNSPIVFTVAAEDRYGNTDPTFNSTVKAGVANNVSGAALGGTVNQTASSGVATFADLTLNKPGVGYTLKATSGGLATTTTPFNVSAGTANQLAVTTLPSPSVTAGNAFTVVIAAEDQYGFVDQNFNGQVSIALATNPGNTSLGGTLSIGAVKGLATFSNLQLNVAALGYTLQATSTGLTPVTSSSISVTAGKATQLVVTTQPGSVIAGQGFGLVVSAEDAYFNVDTTFTGNVSLALGNNPGGSSLAGNLNATAAKGVATFGGLKLNVAATGYTIQASSAGVNTGATNPFTVMAGTATQLAVTTPPSGVVAGTGFSFSVSAEDSLGNVDQNFTGNVAVSLFVNPGNSTLGGNHYAQAVKGVATFTGLTLNVAGSGYILQSIYSGLSPTTTPSFTVTAGHATKLVMVTEPPASVTAGAGFGFVVVAEDAQGNIDTNFAGPATAIIANNPGNSTLGGGTTAILSNGLATFSGLTLNVADPGYTIQAICTGVASATTNPITVNAGKATQLVATTEPVANIGAGKTLTFVVTAEDAYDNVDTTFSGLVSVSLANNPGNSDLSGTNPVPAVNGVSSFTNLSLDRSGKGYTLQGSTSGVTSALSTPFNVTPGSATHLVITAEPPSSVTAGAGFGFVLNAEDTFGNIDTNFNGFVLASIVSNPGNSILGGNLQGSVSNGVVTFSGLTLNKVGTGYTVQANSLGVTSVPTTSLNVNAGAATQLVVTNEPSGVIAGSGFGLTLAAEDNFFNVDTSFGGTVSVALASNPGSASLGGTTTATASQGVASFAGLTINVANPGYTLKVSYPGLTAGVTSQFTVTAGHATKLVMVTQPPASVTAGSGFGFIVYAEDPLGNVDMSFNNPVTVALSANPGNSTLGGSPFANVSNGVAVFSGLTLNVADQGYTLQASSAGLTSTTTNAVQVIPATATQLVITTQPPANVLVDQTFGLTVSAEDADGNVDPNYSGTISLGLLNNPGNANLGGSTSAKASAGVATFSGLTVDQAGSGDTIQAGAIGLFSATTTPFTSKFSLPTTTASLSGTQGTNGWYRSTVSVSLSASDPILTIKQTFYQIDGGTLTLYTAPFQVTGDGVHSVSYYSVNSAGKQENPENTTIQIDTTAPATTASTSGIKGKNSYYTALSLSLSATDATSGVAANYYTINGQTFLYTGPVALPDGNLSITYYSVDVAGNQESAHSLSATVDSTPPVTTANISGTAGLNGYYRSAVKVTLSATDNVSGVAATYYRLGTTGAFTLYRGTVFSFTTQGSHTISYYSVDRAGNKENVETTTVLIDTVPPPLTVSSISAATVVSETVTLSGTSQANASISVVLSDVTAKKAVGVAATDSSGHWTITLDASKLADGRLTAQVTAMDQAGNAKVVTKTTTKSSQVVMVVTQQPVSLRLGSRMPSVVVQLEDGLGHLLDLGGVDVTVSSGATFTGTTTQTSNSLGQVIFPDLYFQSLGTYNLVFTSAGLKTIASISFTVGSGSNYPFWN
jgi:hypothetical protein